MRRKPLIALALIGALALATTPATAKPKKPTLARAAWERIPLSDAIEVHARRPMTREENRLLDDLLKEAERIFGPQPRGNS